ncbi:MAG: hypothetical protein ACRD3L_13760 [Terriglobales bacterium]
MRELGNASVPGLSVRGYGATWNFLILANVSDGAVTLTLPVVTPLGTVAVM